MTCEEAIREMSDYAFVDVLYSSQVMEEKIVDGGEGKQR